MSHVIRVADLRPQSVGALSRRKVWSQTRIAGGLVLLSWGLMFWFLLLTNRVPLYLSTRTSWVVPVGAVLLTAAALGRLAASRTAKPSPIRRRNAIVLTLMVAPVLIILVLPPATLGNFSASKKTSFSTLNYSTIYGKITDNSEITFLSIAAGQTSTEGARVLARRAGSEVALVGIATRLPETPADEFFLTRYVVTCCVSDATTVQVRVVNVVPGQVQPNDWLEVKGQIYPLGRDVIVTPDSIVKVPRPEVPYITP